MKTRTKILITILLALLYFALIQHFNDNGPIRVELPLVPAQKSIGGPYDLKAIYSEFNEQYFYNRLPKDVLIDFSETENYMATTIMMSDERFHIRFNPKYVNAERVVRETMLHEQCHIKTFKWELSLEDIRTKQHGREWRACMLQLDTQGAFRRELIDYYEGN
jgi:hypothetical protein